MSRPGGSEGPLSGEHLREAERGFVAMLRAKRFPAAWIEGNAVDLLAQASSEYAAWLTGHEPEANPVGWLITCAYRRALNLLESQRRRPSSAPLDAVHHLADEGAPTPEQLAIDHDRLRLLREALGRLPRQDRRLLALVYFEERSVREAGRRMGWRKSAADRHHRAALDRLRAIVGEDRSLMSPAVLGLAAWAALAGERGPGIRGATMAPLEGAVGAVAEIARRLGEAARRLLPFAEPGGAAASGGPGRMVGACGAGIAAAVCGLFVAGVQPALPGHSDSPPLRRAVESSETSVPERDRVAVSRNATPTATSAESADGGAEPRRARASAKRPAPAHAQDKPSAGAATAAPASQVTEEFGIEGEGEPPPGEQTVSAPAEPTHASTSPPPKTAPPAREATGAQVSEEFGL